MVPKAVAKSINTTSAWLPTWVLNWRSLANSNNWVVHKYCFPKACVLVKKEISVMKAIGNFVPGVTFYVCKPGCILNLVLDNVPFLERLPHLDSRPLPAWKRGTTSTTMWISRYTYVAKLMRSMLQHAETVKNKDLCGPPLGECPVWEALLYLLHDDWNI